MFEDVPFSYQDAKDSSVFPDGLKEEDYYRYLARNQIDILTHLKEGDSW